VKTRFLLIPILCGWADCAALPDRAALMEKTAAGGESTWRKL
jgi:hypothetical protein